LKKVKKWVKKYEKLKKNQKNPQTANLVELSIFEHFQTYISLLLPFPGTRWWKVLVFRILDNVWPDSCSVSLTTGTPSWYDQSEGELKANKIIHKYILTYMKLTTCAVSCSKTRWI